MSKFLETTVDKFTFRVATGRSYTAEGLWAATEGNLVRVGLSDYLQQRSGDVAFVEVKPVGAMVTAGDELATLETIKVNTSLPSPVTGKVTQVNPALENTPEVINSDPYGDGWLAVIEFTDWESDRFHLQSAEQYLGQVKQQAEEDSGSHQRDVNKQ